MSLLRVRWVRFRVIYSPSSYRHLYPSSSRSIAFHIIVVVVAVVL